jgi:hypothetical protein
VQLDAARAAVERTLGLGERPVLRVQPAEREQPAVAPPGLLDHDVVRGRIPVRLVHREDERPRVDALQGFDQLLAAASVAVRVVRPDVGVRVEWLEAGDVLAQPVEPRHHARVWDHGS